MRDQRRQRILVAVLGVVLVAVLLKTVVLKGDGGDDATAPTSPAATGLTSDDGTAIDGGLTTTTADPDAIPETPDTFDVFEGKNPFEPAIQVTPSTGSPTTTTTNSTGTTGTTVPGQTTTTTTAPTNNPTNPTVTLNSVTKQSNGTYVATITVGGTLYSNVLEGQNFGPGDSYKFVKGTSDTCGQFQHGDALFNLCENFSTNK